MNLELLLYSFYREHSEGSDILGNLLKITQATREFKLNITEKSYFYYLLYSDLPKCIFSFVQKPIRKLN